MALDRPAGYHVVGTRIPLVDGPSKVRGEAPYTDDFRFPGMLVAKILRSPHAHARILSIDTREAEALPGVRAVCTGAEYPERFGVLPISNDETALAVEKVRHVGEGVVGVAADDEETALRALRLVKVEYEPLPEYLKPRQGLKDVTEPIHGWNDRLPKGTNIHKRVSQDFGDVTAARAASAHVAGATYEFESVNHAFTEPHCTIARWDATGRLEMWSAQQVPHYLHKALSKVLGIDMDRIRIVRPNVGGGFGGKSDPFPHEMVVAILAKKSGRPVRLLFDREEVFLSHHGRHPTKTVLSAGCDAEGRITFLDLDATIDGGAFGSFGVVTTYYNGVLSVGPYRIPNFRYEGRRVYTNKPVCGAMRGHGAVNTRMALEVTLDELAEARGESPVDFRLRNLLAGNSTTVNGFRITSIGMKECLERVRDASDLERLRRTPPYGKGIGLGGGFYISGSAHRIHRTRLPQSTVHLKIDVDGGITVHSMAAEIGQGSDTMLALCVAEELKCPIERIRVRSWDTDLAPVDLGSYSSRVTFMAGNAARRAAAEIAGKLLRAGSRLTGYPVENLELRDDHVVCRHDPSVRVGYRQVLDEALADNGALIAKGIYGDAPPMGGEHKGAAAGLSPTYSYQAFVALVDVDDETGMVRVEDLWAAHDVGRALNRLAVEGQIEGSVHMGLGQALMETQEYLAGRIKFPNLLDYKIPMSLDVPRIHPLVVEADDPEGPYGAKECGEGALAPVLPAVANAVYDAVGVRIRSLPLTPDRVWKELEKARKAGLLGKPRDRAKEARRDLAAVSAS